MYNGSVFSKDVQEAGVKVFHGIVSNKYLFNIGIVSLNHIGKSNIYFR